MVDQLKDFDSNIINYEVFENNKNKIKVPKNICNINKVVSFNYGTNNFHSNLILQYKEFVEKNGISFSYYDNEFKFIFGYSGFWCFATQNSDIYEKYIGFNEDYKENTYSFENVKKTFNDFLLNYKQDNNTLYVFNAEDIMAFFYYYDATNYELFYKFINDTKYIIFQCEVMTDINLLTIGLTSKEVANKYFKDFNLFERIKFLKDLYLKSQQIYICDSKNKYFLESNGANNVKYFPPYINIPYKNVNIEKTIDCLFYGNIFPTLIDTYRNIMLDKLKTILGYEINFIARENIYNHELVDVLNNTKIVLHIPSHINLRTMPWAKIAYLMSNKIFFIIEENDELYFKNMQNIIIYYQRENVDDLKNKIIYYINNENERVNVAEKCYNYYINNFNEKELLEDLIC